MWDWIKADFQSIISKNVLHCCRSHAVNTQDFHIASLNNMNFAQDHFLYPLYNGHIWFWANHNIFFFVLRTQGYIRQVLPTWIIALLYGIILRQLDFAMLKQSSSFYVRLDGHMVLNCGCDKTLWQEINSFLSKPIKYKNCILHFNIKF